MKNTVKLELWKKRVNDVIKILLSKKYRIYTIIVAVNLFMVIPFAVKVVFNFQANNKLQVILNADNIEDFDYFGERNQYVAINHRKANYYNTEDNVVQEMVGRNHFIRYYDAMGNLHKGYLVIYDLDNI